MRVLASAVLFSLAALLVQQSRPSTIAPGISGTVVGQAGRPLAGADVELLSGARVERKTTSSVKGEFRFEAVVPGRYTVRASLQGFVTGTTPVVVTAEGAAPVLRLILAAAPAPPPAVLAPADAAAAARGQAAGGAAGDVIGGIAGTLRAPAALAESVAMSRRRDFNTEAYDRIEENRFRRPTDEPLSTFSIDVDTASYANVRRFLTSGTLPPPDAVRTEELINYFRFAYPEPKGGTPFSITTEVSGCPWNPRHRLALIGLQAPRLAAERTPPRNLVFLLDVSGSMDEPDKLPLVKTAMRMLAETLVPADRVAIVVYAGASGLALPSTPGSRKAEIQQAIASLTPGGSTNGAAGIQLAYNIAAANFVKSGINRVILATDGDFNVGVTSQGELIRLIEEQRERGIFLSVLGVGTGNLKDSTMEKLADKGNGNYAYLDSLHEARRVLIAEAGATLVTVAKDVKIQVEFNPAAVAAYRLVGYENRLLNKEDFNDDKKDAGEIGAGHTVTALYELIPHGEPVEGSGVDALKYQTPATQTGAARSGELMTVKVRYKQPEGDTSQLLAQAVRDAVDARAANIGFAAAVAQYGMLLRNSPFKAGASWTSALALARESRGNDADGYRAEFIRLVELAAALDAQRSVTGPGR